MIDLQSERVLPLLRVAQRFDVNFSTVWRWARKGTRTPAGAVVKLEVVRLGGRWVTTEAALRRYSEALTTAHHTTVDIPDAPTLCTPSQRFRRSERAAAELARRGI